jgi:uncharacterized protein YndB with AHSA1/START domain
MHVASVVLLVIVAGVLVVAALAAAKPDTIAIVRAVDVNAPPEQVFSLVDDLRRWAEWPADTEQAQMARTFGAISRGKGATSEWTGSGSAGAGRMEITDSTPPSKVVVAVDFRKPFVAHNVNEFTLEPQGGSTRVSWTWHGENVLLLRVMSVFVSPDTMMGSHFESGLRALKNRAESSSR